MWGLERIRRWQVGYRAGFRHTVALFHQASESQSARAGNVGCKRSGGREDGLEAGEVVTVNQRVGCQSGDDGRHEMGHGYAVFLDSTEHLFEVEARRLGVGR